MHNCYVEVKPGPKEVTRTVSRLTEGLGVTELAEDVFWKQQQAAASGQNWCAVSRCCGRTNGLVSLASNSHFRGLVNRHLCCYILEMMIHLRSLQFKTKGLFLKLSLFG